MHRTRPQRRCLLLSILKTVRHSRRTGPQPSLRFPLGPTGRRRAKVARFPCQVLIELRRSTRPSPNSSTNRIGLVRGRRCFVDSPCGSLYPSRWASRKTPRRLEDMLTLSRLSHLGQIVAVALGAGGLVAWAVPSTPPGDDVVHSAVADYIRDNPEALIASLNAHMERERELQQAAEKESALPAIDAVPTAERLPV